ncbi:MAG: hypothetical protein KBA71_05790 [Opitutaceae bacterium]|nr:hypothetical protein [Opitutaceae bacterium]
MTPLPSRGRISHVWRPSPPAQGPVPSSRTGRRAIVSLCILTGLLGATSAHAAGAAVPESGVRDKLVFSDDFDRTGLGTALRSPIPAFTVADGLLKGRQERSDHGGTLAAILPLPDGNAIVEIKFRFSGARSFNLACDDISYRGTHAGHISRVTVRPNQITLYDDKEGVMRNDIYALRRSGDPQKKAEGDRLAKNALVNFPLKLEQNRWYSLRVSIIGDLLTVNIDNRQVGHLKSPGLAHPSKPNLRLSVWGATPAQEVQFDTLRVWSVRSDPTVH